jgi:hypothetical protein
VLTEAIEAERGVGAATVTAAVLAGTVMATTTARMAISTVVAAALAPDRDLHTTTDITAPRVAPAEMSAMKIDVLAATVTHASEVAREVKTKPLNSTKMNAIGAPFSCSNSRRD